MSNDKNEAAQFLQKIKDLSASFEKGKPDLKGLKKLQEQLGNEKLAPKLPGNQFVIYGGFSGDFGDECNQVDVPYIAPKFKLEWVDGPSDQIETHDNEVL